MSEEDLDKEQEARERRKAAAEAAKADKYQVSTVTFRSFASCWCRCPSLILRVCKCKTTPKARLHRVLLRATACDELFWLACFLNRPFSSFCASQLALVNVVCTVVQCSCVVYCTESSYALVVEIPVMHRHAKSASGTTFGPSCDHAPLLSMQAAFDQCNTGASRARIMAQNRKICFQAGGAGCPSLLSRAVVVDIAHCFC